MTVAGTYTEVVWRQYMKANAMASFMDTALRETGLSFQQAMTLMAIADVDSPQPTSIARAMGQIHTQTLTGTLDRLERAGFIRRVRDLRDRRAVRLVLSEQAAADLPAVRKRLEQAAAACHEMEDDDE